MGMSSGMRQIIYERMDILLSLAAAALRKGDEKHAKRYVFLARKLSTRYNCRFSPGQDTVLQVVRPSICCRPEHESAPQEKDQGRGIRLQLRRQKSN